MTYRERRERKAERLREWADKREVKAETLYASSHAITDQIPFGQPILVGHHSERSDRNRRDRAWDQIGRSVEHSRKADEMRSRAENIERAARQAIYSDDPDARERLVEKIAKLEAERAEIKARNTAFRKEHAAELKAMSPYERDWTQPFPSYVSTNLSGNISRLRKRLAVLS